MSPSLGAMLSEQLDEQREELESLRRALKRSLKLGRELAGLVLDFHIEISASDNVVTLRVERWAEIVRRAEALKSAGGGSR